VGIFGRGRRGGRQADDGGIDDQYTAAEYAAPYATEYAEYVDDYDDDLGAGYEGVGYEGDGPHAGPYDESQAPDDGLARLDLGSVRIPLPPQAQVQVEMDPAGPLRAIHLLTVNGRFTISGYAAPRSEGLWSAISGELAGQLHNDGARVRKENGEWGTELVAFVNDTLLRFVGVDGPRWMLRAVSAGPKESSAKAAAELRDIVRSTVVVRGVEPMPVRTPLPLVLPPEIIAHIEQAQAGQQPGRP
jgi:hypothetical protein